MQIQLEGGRQVGIVAKLTSLIIIVFCTVSHRIQSLLAPTILQKVKPMNRGSIKSPPYLPLTYPPMRPGPSAAGVQLASSRPVVEKQTVVRGQLIIPQLRSACVERKSQDMPEMDRFHQFVLVEIVTSSLSAEIHRMCCKQ